MMWKKGKRHRVTGGSTSHLAHSRQTLGSSHKWEGLAALPLPRAAPAHPQPVMVAAHSIPPASPPSFLPGLPAPSGRMPLSCVSGDFQIGLLSGRKTPCYGMLEHILSSQEDSHFSEQMPIWGAWRQPHHLWDTLCSSITNRRLTGAAAPSAPEEASQTQQPPPSFSNDPMTLCGKKTNIVFDLQLTGFTNNDKEMD